MSHSENISTPASSNELTNIFQQLKEALLLVNNFEFITRSEFATDQINLQKFYILPHLKALTLFRMGFFGASHEWGGGAFWLRLPKICHTHPTMMKLGTVIPYLRKIQKKYKSRDTSLEFC